MSQIRRILISGGSGYLGFRTALEYLKATSDTRVLLTVHAASEDELARKTQLLRAAAGHHGHRVETVRVELEDEEPFRLIDAASIDTIIHSAAVTRFNVEEELAQKVNILGTEKLLRFASQCRNLSAVSILSSIYASGMRAGSVSETRLDSKSGFANHYERSKWMSEELLFEKYAQLPWKIFRVSTVLADNDSGQVIQQNAVHNTLKLFYYGLISLIPGLPGTPVYLVNGDFVARAVREGTDRFPERKIYHVCHAFKDSLTLGQMIEIAHETFLQDEFFRTRRILKPLFTDSKSFDALVKGATAFGGNVLTQAVTSIAPFGAQLFIRKEVNNDELASRLSGYTAPDAAAQIKRTCEFLAGSKFSKINVAEAKYES
jgi:thioester reductase-like protein